MGLNISECTHIFSTVSISIVWRIYQFLNGNKIKQTVLQVRFSSTNTYTFTISVFILFFFFVWRIYVFVSDNKKQTNKITGASLQLIHTRTSISVFICFVWSIYPFLKGIKLNKTMLQDRIYSTITHIHPSVSLFVLYEEFSSFSTTTKLSKQC